MKLKSPTDPNDLEYHFSWYNPLKKKPTSADPCADATGKVTIYPPRSKLIVFPTTDREHWNGTSRVITFYALPKNKYAVYKTIDGDVKTGALPEDDQGVYWFDIFPGTQGAPGRLMGYFVAKGHGGEVTYSDPPAKVLIDQNNEKNPHEDFFQPDVEFLYSILRRARTEAKIRFEQEKNKEEHKPNFFGYGGTPVPTTPEEAFFQFKSLCTSGLRNTAAARAYVVDWALAERRTGFSFPSMKAFEEWAAQQGLTVLAVVDAPDGGDERASEIASESEGEM